MQEVLYIANPTGFGASGIVYLNRISGNIDSHRNKIYNQNEY
ncbi:MAG: hypothetical protein K0S75_1351 [Clostridia bacterium]|jgi:hypothetical protein|nr:hypothetical protein [Clostridia bacterium]